MFLLFQALGLTVFISFFFLILIVFSPFSFYASSRSFLIYIYIYIFTSVSFSCLYLSIPICRSSGLVCFQYIYSSNCLCAVSVELCTSCIYRIYRSIFIYFVSYCLSIPYISNYFSIVSIELYISIVSMAYIRTLKLIVVWEALFWYFWGRKKKSKTAMLLHVRKQPTLPAKPRGFSREGIRCFLPFFFVLNSPFCQWHLLLWSACTPILDPQLMWSDLKRQCVFNGTRAITLLFSCCTIHSPCQGNKHLFIRQFLLYWRFL